MSALVIILLSTVLIQGSSIALGEERSSSSARLSLGTELREAAFTLITITLSSFVGYAITYYALKPLQVEYLRLPSLVFLTALIIVITRSRIDQSKQNSNYHVLVLMTNQCALLGVTLFVSYYADSLLESFLYGAGAAISLAILSAAFRALTERIEPDSIPFVFRGIPISLISAGLMALALMGFAGIVRN